MRVKVVRSKLCEAFGNERSIFIDQEGTVTTPYMESFRGHLVQLDDMLLGEPIPFEPDELAVAAEVQSA
jgi:hypothetical protein